MRMMLRRRDLFKIASSGKPKTVTIARHLLWINARCGG
jgi:hypothetical protein